MKVLRTNKPFNFRLQRKCLKLTSASASNSNDSEAPDRSPLAGILPADFGKDFTLPTLSKAKEAEAKKGTEEKALFPGFPILKRALLCPSASGVSKNLLQNIVQGGDEKYVRNYESTFNSNFIRGRRCGFTPFQISLHSKPNRPNFAETAVSQ